jgi:hypothetical protein
MVPPRTQSSAASVPSFASSSTFARSAPREPPSSAHIPGRLHLLKPLANTLLLSRATAQLGPQHGFTPSDVSAKSLRASGAIAAGSLQRTGKRSYDRRKDPRLLPWDHPATCSSHHSGPTTFQLHATTCNYILHNNSSLYILPSPTTRLPTLPLRSHFPSVSTRLR